MTGKKTYGPKEVCNQVGISMRQLNYWKLIGVVNPRREIHRTKIFHRYTQHDIQNLEAIRKLTEEGYRVSKAAERIKRMLQGSKNHPVDLLDALQASPTPQMTAMTHFMQRLQEELTRAQRFHDPVSCLVIKIGAGDGAENIKAFMSRMEKTLISTKRRYDIILQAGANEFLWILPQTGEEGAKAVSNRIFRLLQDQGLPATVTIQIGAATLSSNNDSPESIIERARRAFSTVKEVNYVEAKAK